MMSGIAVGEGTKGMKEEHGSKVSLFELRTRRPRDATKAAGDVEKADSRESG
jgi:hypothetical protein